MHHLRELAASCADVHDQPMYRFRVKQMWAFGEILDEPRDLDLVQVALAVDLPVAEVPWLSEPAGTEHWANSTRLSKNPIRAFWRSVEAPVWNHCIERPALLWDAANGLVEETFAALHDGRGSEVRSAPPAAAELEKRRTDELALSLATLRAAHHTYDQRRWGQGKLTPVADQLWLATAGHLDLLDG